MVLHFTLFDKHVKKNTRGKVVLQSFCQNFVHKLTTFGRCLDVGYFTQELTYRN